MANHKATITGQTTDSVMQGTATGRLAVMDRDPGEAHTKIVINAAAKYGTWSTDADGHWTYQLDNSSAAFRSLGAGKTATDRFTIASLDGTATKTVTVTIHGVNDPASISGATSGTVKEDGRLTVSGKLAVSDVDTGEAHLRTTASTATAYGHWSVDGRDTWKYVVNNTNAAVQALNANQTLTDTFIVTSKDGSAHQTITITIKGDNDAAAPTYGTTASVTEDLAISAAGAFTLVDKNNVETHAKTVTDAASKPEAKSADADGNGTNHLDNSSAAVQSPDMGKTVTDSFTVTSLDGTATKAAIVATKDTDEAPTAPADTGPAAPELPDNAAASAGADFTPHATDRGDSVHKSVAINPDGRENDMPAGDDNGSGSFTYQIDDGADETATARVSLLLDPHNSAPVLPGAPTITLVSTDAAGDQGDSASFDPVFSPDGTKVAFASYAADLVPGDTNLAEDIFVKDLASGAITRIAAGEHPVFSPDGTKIAFASLTSNLVPGDTNSTYDIFVKDLVTGTLTRASSDAAGNGANSYSYDPVFSPDSTKVAYYSGATNLVPGDTNNTYDVFVKDLTTGGVTLITTNSVGAQGNEESFSLVFSPDGSKIVFASLASNMTPGDTNDKLDIFVKDLATGAVTLVSSDAAGGQSNDHSEHPLWSPDGTKVAFLSDASNLVPGDTNGSLDIFVKDLATGAITRVSTDAAGNQGNGDSGGAVFSSDGTKLAFWSLAGNLVPNDTNVNYDVFIKDLATGAITRVSEIDGLQGNSMSLNPAFSPDGKSIAFYSYSNNLVPNDANSNHDIFVKTLPPSIAFNAIPGDPAVNDGQSVASLLGSKVTDADADALKGIAVVGADTAHGAWQYSLDGGGSWQTLGAVSDASATLLADTALVRFQPDAHWNGLADITIRAWDQTDGHLSGDAGVDVSVNGGSTAYSDTTAEVDITVTPVNNTTLDLLASTTTEGPDAAYVFTASLSGASHGTTTIHTDKGDITIADGQATGTLTISSGNGEDVYSDASSLTATITGTEGGSFENLVVGTNTATAKVNDTVNTTTVTLDDAVETGTLGRATITAHIAAAVTGSDLVISLSNGATITIPVGQTSGTSADFAATTDVTISVSGTSGGNYEGLNTSDTSILLLDPHNSAPVLPGAPTITLVSTDAAGDQGDSASFDPVFSPDGTKVAFASYAADLVPGDTNLAEDIFVKDLASGAITRIAAGEHPVFSPDGTKIAFASLTSNLVPGDTNSTYDIFVKDLVTGTLTRASSDAAGNGANSYSYDPVFSPDSTKVAYYSGATNLVPGDTNNTYDVFVKDLTTGGVTLITTNSVGAQGNEESFSLVFSPDGSKIVFASLASNMTPGDTNDKLDIFVKDLATGAVTLVSSDAAGGQSNDHSEHPLWSPDGTKVAFLSDASNLVPGDTNGSLDIFVKDLATGAITRVSTDAAGNQGNGDSGGAVFSSDGTKLAFWSLAGNLVPNDTNVNYDVFIKDLATGAITRVSEIDGLQGNSMSLNPAFSPDGKSIAFYSYSNNLVPNDANSNHDIFVKTLPPSIAFNAIPGDPAVNDGQSVASLLGSKVTDADADALKGIAVVGADTAHGAWQYSLDGGGSWQTLGAVSDASATLLADTALVRFQPDAHWNGLADITIRAWDQTDGHLSGDAGVDVSVNGGSTAYSDTTAEVDITVTPVNNTTLDLLASTTTEGPDAAYVFTASLSGASHGTTTIHTDKGDITIADGQATGTLTISSGNGEDVYSDASSLTATITGTEGGSFENLVVGTNTATAKVNDTVNTTTVTLDDAVETGTLGRATITAHIAAAVTGSDLVISLSNGATITIPVGQTSGTSADFAATTDVTISVSGTSGGNYEGLNTSDTSILLLDPHNSAPVLPGAPTITLVSTDAAGDQGDSASFDPVFSPDGTKVAFASYAADLVPGDTNLAEDIFVKDLASGAITRIAAGEHPVFSPDGTKIAFASLTSNLVPGDTNSTYDIFVKDLVTGTLTRASSDAAGNGANSYSYDPVFSPDSTKVAYYSGATNLVPGDTNNTYDVFVKDLTTGGVTLITTNSVGAQGNEESFSLVFSPDGSKIVFASLASNMTPGDTNDKLDIFVKDLATGAVTLVSSDAAGGQSNDHSEHPLWSPDGTKVAFLSDASNLVPGDTNGSLDIFVKDLATGAITRVSTDAAGNQGNGDSGGAVFSSDGTKLAFWSLAGNLVPNDTNVNYDVFIKDLATGAITRVSEIDGLQGNSMSLNPAFSPDGKSIAFYSYSNNLVPNDANSNHDIFVKTLPPSIAFNAIPGDPAVNDGQSVASLLGSKVTDADADALKGIAVVGADTAHGAWQYSLDGGGSWQTLGAVSDASATLLADTALVRFQPDAHWNGLADITIRAWDQTDGHLSGDAGVDVSVNGGSTAYSDTTAEVDITVTPVNNTTLDLLASIGADAFVFDQASVTHNNGSMVVDDGFVLALSGIVENTGTISLESTGGRTELELLQHGVSFQGAGQILLSDSDGNVITGAGSDVTLINVDNTISGAGNIGEGSLTLVNHGAIVATGAHALEIDTGSNAVVNAGILEATGSGGLHIHGDVENDGLIFANGGGIEIDGNVSGKGGAEIEGTTMLEFSGLFDENLSIGATATGTVKIDHAADFTGIVAGLDDNDSIVFGDILAANASITYTAGANGGIGQLEVTDGEHTANLTLVGNYEAAGFHVVNNGGAGAVVTYTHVEPQQEQVPTV